MVDHAATQSQGGAPRPQARARAASLPTPSAALIAQVQHGDRRALDELTRLIRPHIERQLGRYPVSDDDRLDILQSTLLQVVRRIRSFRGDSSFTTWLFRVTANEALMLMRQQRRQRARLVEGLDFEDLSALPTMRTLGHDDAASLAERQAYVRSALGELPDDYRNIVLAHYHEELGLQEIAKRFSVTESAVRSRLHRARVRLRAIFGTTAAGREIGAESTA